MNDTAIDKLRRILDSLDQDAELRRLVAARDEVIGRYQPIFAPGAVQGITQQQVQEFLQLKNNQHWSGLSRHGGRLTADMPLLRRALGVLVDESRPIRERLDQLRPPSGPPMVARLGRAILTPILMISYPDRYGVWNNPSNDALKLLGLHPRVPSTRPFSERYLRLNEVLVRTAEQLGVDLWTLDALWWRVIRNKEEAGKSTRVAESAGATRYGSAAWIFQADPHLFRLMDALKEHKELTWRVTRYKQKIAAGDRVYLWEGRAEAGIVAVAHTLGNPEPGLPDDAWAKDFQLDGWSESESEWRVRLAVDRVLEQRIPKQRILEDPALGQLQILRMRQGTNFPVTVPEAAALDRLIEEAPSVPASPRRRIWLVGAGRAGDQWAEFRERGVVRIGFHQVGNLRDYSTADALAARMREERSDGRNPRNDVRALFDFAHVMHPGDIIIAKSGRKAIHGFGVIASDYLFLPDRASYQHERRVDWRAVGDWHMPGETNLPTKTMTEISRWPEFVDKIFAAAGLRREEFEGAPTGHAPLDRAELLADVLLDPTQIDDILDLWRRKKNLILQGPPGVGKTFLSKRLAYALMGERSNERLAIVQFHQSFSYEDFVRGYRPVGEGFELRDGVFHEFCARARRRPDREHVFVIDEINRGNLSKILGELMMLVEADKRGPEWAMPLSYQRHTGETFFVPDNVYLLGLMNTADRSLAMVDYALRRRFSFVTLQPAFQTERFRELLEDAGAEPALVTRIVERMTGLNEKIRSDSANLGPGFEIGHSFFCPTESEVAFDEVWYRRVIQHEVAPLLREYWFDDRDKANQLAEDLLRADS